MFTLGEWAASLRRSAAICRPTLHATLDLEMQHLAAEAAEYPGKYGGWPSLSPYTIATKVAGGYPTPSPLLREGILQQSIHGLAIDMYGVVGSTDPVNVFHEVGTAKMPPRPIFSFVMQRNLPHLHEVFGEVAVRLLMPGR